MKAGELPQPNPNSLCLPFAVHLVETSNRWRSYRPAPGGILWLLDVVKGAAVLPQEVTGCPLQFEGMSVPPQPNLSAPN